MWGTLAFKAPEFWDQKPGNKVRYHRNVDVYAAGLTFTAMLQAKSGRKLVPHAEGSLQTSETKMPIGLAAFTRKINKQPDVIVVKTKNNDKKKHQTTKGDHFANDTRKPQTTMVIQSSDIPAE